MNTEHKINTEAAAEAIEQQNSSVSQQRKSSTLRPDKKRGGRAHIRHLVLSALFLAIAQVLPYVTGQIPEVGAMLCPMHIPVLLCGFFCPLLYSMAVGAVAPLMRSLLTGGFPPLFPTAVCMAFELAAYGGGCALFRRLLPKKAYSVPVALVLSMVIGRLIWGGAMFVCTGLGGGEFGLAAFWAGAVANAVPGIVLQLVLVPILVLAVDRSGAGKLH